MHNLQYTVFNSNQTCQLFVYRTICHFRELTSNRTEHETLNAVSDHTQHY